MDGLRDTLRRTGGIHAVASELDQSPSAIAAVFEALLPLVVSALHLHSNAAGGEERGCRAVIDTLERAGGGGLAAEVMTPGPSDPVGGDNLIASLIGDPIARSAVVNAAAAQTGADPALVSQVLPRLAMLVGGYVAARASEQPRTSRLDEIVAAGEHEHALTRILAGGGPTVE